MVFLPGVLFFHRRIPCNDTVSEGHLPCGHRGFGRGVAFSSLCRVCHVSIIQDVHHGNGTQEIVERFNHPFFESVQTSDFRPRVNHMFFSSVCFARLRCLVLVA
jgi:hypothetical protein